MDIVWAILFLVGGFVMLVKGADWFVDGAAGLAEKLHVPQLVIGLTVVAFGTSAPELATSLTATISGDLDIAIGNALGSNITNVLLILGLSACFCALPAQKNLLVLDLPLLLASTAAFLLFGYFDDEIGRLEGGILLFTNLAYIAFLIWWAFKKRAKEGGKVALNDHEVLVEGEKEPPKTPFGAWYERMKEKTWFLGVATVVGLGFVVGGATLAVDGAETIAYAVGLSERIVGLTVIAIGTSLPELITCVVAARKGETDIAVGDIIGSNLSNIMRVIGICALVSPLPFTASSGVNYLVDSLFALGAVGLLALFVYLPAHKVKRWQGGIMLAAFVAYYIYLFV